MLVYARLAAWPWPLLEAMGVFITCWQSSKLALYEKYSAAMTEATRFIMCKPVQPLYLVKAPAENPMHVPKTCFSIFGFLPLYKRNYEKLARPQSYRCPQRCPQLCPQLRPQRLPALKVTVAPSFASSFDSIFHVLGRRRYNFLMFIRITFLNKFMVL